MPDAPPLLDGIAAPSDSGPDEPRTGSGVERSGRSTGGSDADGEAVRDHRAAAGGVGDEEAIDEHPGDGGLADGDSSEAEPIGDGVTIVDARSDDGVGGLRLDDAGRSGDGPLAAGSPAAVSDRAECPAPSTVLEPDPAGDAVQDATATGVVGLTLEPAEPTGDGSSLFTDAAGARPVLGQIATPTAPPETTTTSRRRMELQHRVTAREWLTDRLLDPATFYHRRATWFLIALCLLLAVLAWNRTGLRLSRSAPDGGARLVVGAAADGPVDDEGPTANRPSADPAAQTTFNDDLGTGSSADPDPASPIRRRSEPTAVAEPGTLVSAAAPSLDDAAATAAGLASELIVETIGATTVPPEDEAPDPDPDDGAPIIEDPDPAVPGTEPDPEGPIDSSPPADPDPPTTLGPSTEPEPTTTPRPTTAPDPEPTTAPRPTTTPRPTTEPDPEPTTAPTPTTEPDPEPTTAPIPITDPPSEPDPPPVQGPDTSAVVGPTP